MSSTNPSSPLPLLFTSKLLESLKLHKSTISSTMPADSSSSSSEKGHPMNSAIHLMWKSGSSLSSSYVKNKTFPGFPANTAAHCSKMVQPDSLLPCRTCRKPLPVKGFPFQAFSFCLRSVKGIFKHPWTSCRCRSACTLSPSRILAMTVRHVSRYDPRRRRGIRIRYLFIKFIIVLLHRHQFVGILRQQQVAVVSRRITFSIRHGKC
mgnify:CR=1 FL=1